MGNNVRVVTVTNELLAQALHLPAGASVRAVQPAWGVPNATRLLVEHPDFTPTAGCMVPEVGIEYTRSADTITSRFVEVTDD